MQRVLCVTDSTLKLSKKWFYPEVVTALEREQVRLTVSAHCGASLREMREAMERELDTQTFHCIILLCMGTRIGEDTAESSVAELVPLLTTARNNLVLYGGMSEWWKHVPMGFEDLAKAIRHRFTDFAGVNCQDGRNFYLEAKMVKSDFDGANHIHGCSRWKAIEWFRSVVRSVAGTTPVACGGRRPTRTTTRERSRSRSGGRRSWRRLLGLNSESEDECDEQREAKQVQHRLPMPSGIFHEVKRFAPIPGGILNEVQQPLPIPVCTSVPTAALDYGPRNMLCANPRCEFLVHRDPAFGNYCCRKCHYLSTNPSKAKKKHGPMCQGRVGNGQLRASPAPPVKVWGK